MVDGVVNRYYKNHIIEAIRYVDGKLNGNSFYFDENSSKVGELRYIDNTIDYIKVIRPQDNSTILELSYANGKAGNGYCYDEAGKQKVPPRYKTSLLILIYKLIAQEEILKGSLLLDFSTELCK